MNHFEEKLKSFQPRNPSIGQREQILANARAKRTDPPSKPISKARNKRASLLTLATSRWFIFAFMPLLVFGTAGICAVSIDGHKVGQQWKDVEKMLAAAGETLDLPPSPHPVPDADNFMATPALLGIEMERPRDPDIVAKHARISALPKIRVRTLEGTEVGAPIDLGAYSIYNDSKDRQTAPQLHTLGVNPEEAILKALNVDAALWEELSVAARRPHSQPVTSYADQFEARKSWELSSSHQLFLYKIGTHASLRAMAAARIGDRGMVFDSLAIVLKCHGAIACDGVMISFYVTNHLETRLPDILRAECLTTADLVWLQTELTSVNILELALQIYRRQLARSARFFDEIIALPRGERADVLGGYWGGNSSELSATSVMSFSLPNSFFIRNKSSSLDWWYRFRIKPLKELDLTAMRAVPKDFAHSLADTGWLFGGARLAKDQFGTPGWYNARVIRSEMRLRLMVLGLALERFYRDNGNFPTKLQTLVPDYLDVVPIDLAAETEGDIVTYELAPDARSYNLRATPLFPDDDRAIRNLQFRR